MAPLLQLVAREAEVKILTQARASSKSEFLALYGRRRIGKTYLVNEVFKDDSFYFSFTGTKDLPTLAQIRNFIRALEDRFQISISKAIETWSDALTVLPPLIEAAQKKSKGKQVEKKVIFFDELPWIASNKSGFCPALDYFWNSYASKRNDILLIVCGSEANWMISEIVNSKGGFHNRITRPPLAMAPFTLKETQEYLVAKGVKLNTTTVAEIYMATGGVAYYLDLVNPGESAAQFMSSSFFAEMGGLRNEFDRLFKSLFDGYDAHVAVVRTLAKHSSGLSYPELAKRIQMATGGTYTKILTELEKSNFISFTPKIGKKKREGLYRLTDEYTLFYLTWIDDLGSTFRDPMYWQKQVGKPKYNSWLGQAFEALCFKHSWHITKALSIAGLTTHVYGFRNPKVQIDMVIDRSDKTMNLCEMKYTAAPFNMTALEAKKISLRKQELLAHLAGIKAKSKQVFVTLITAEPAKRNQHYLGVVDNEVLLEELFKY